MNLNDEKILNDNIYNINNDNIYNDNINNDNIYNVNIYDTIDIQIKRNQKKIYCKRALILSGIVCMNLISFMLGSFFYSKYYININDEESSSNN